MNATAQAMDNLTLNVTQEIHVRASLDATFAALLEEVGPHNEMADGKPMLRANSVRLFIPPAGNFHVSEPADIFLCISYRLRASLRT